MQNEIQIAETIRLKLSKITVEDASFLLELMNPPNWLKYNGDRHVRTLYGITLPINHPSIKLLEKLGLSYQKTIKPFEDDKELLLFAKEL